MKNNMFLKLLCSIPVILITLYFVPFLGICLMVFRYYVYRNNKKISITLVICGLLLVVPKLFYFIIDTFNIDIVIPYLNDFVVSDVYTKLLSYSKLLIIVGVISYILSYIFTILGSKLGNEVSKYMKQELNKDYEIRKENDMKMQEKREKAKNTHVVKCPYCGSDNMLTEQTGTCKFCRRKIEYK